MLNKVIPITILVLIVLSGCVSNENIADNDTINDLTGAEANTQNTDNSVNDCGTDFSCFIEASEECNSATVTYTTTATVRELIQYTTLKYELKDKKEDSCTLHFKYSDFDAEYTEEARTNMENQGLTQDQIDNQLAKRKNMLKLFVSLADFTCVSPTEEINKLLVQFESEPFPSEDDFQKAGCVGPEI